MGEIKSVKNQFITRESYNTYSDCMYMPTWEKFRERAVELINDTSVSIFGFSKNNCIIGLIVIKQNNDETAEIKGIAVNSIYRKQGIGKQLIQYAFDNLEFSVLFAETDDDAISFYRHCDFKTEEFYRNFGSGDYKRYKCVLKRL